MKLFLGIPSAGSPAKPFLASLARIALPPNAESVERAVVTGNFVPAQRDLLVERAMAAGADVLVMCDDDMVLPPDALVRLCATLERDPLAGLAGALYYSRDGFRPMAVAGWDARDTRGAVIPAFDAEPVEVDGVGFGCVAIRMRAIEAFAPPYFSAHVFLERAAGRARVCDEDYLFCARLLANGSRVLLDPGVRCGHYDRASGNVYPLQWEPASITARARGAAREAGVPARVDAARAPASRTAETHVSASLEYLLVP